MDENILLQKQVTALRRGKWPTQLAREFITHLLFECKIFGQGNLTDEEEETLNNIELFDSFKPFYVMDFIDKETDREDEVQLPTAMETESSNGKMSAEPRKSQEFTRKIMKKAFSIGKKSSITFLDSKIKAME
ncbi:hypothetical protein M9H77_36374 [Catharanthus roseus]|uniref:Uncharacterized protein n=1 Tax=Catharanthus roseus TaxID=4058 RepID=A0ACB9ZTE8_CATRO|nr:hypothetical protein M9H77_36374 [Catharanthus roseus]